MDAVIKVGGSLAEGTERLKALCRKLSELAKKYALIVVPGGGRFADVVRDFDQRFSLPKSVSHRMALLGMDMFGLLLSGIMHSCRVFRQFDDAEELFGKGVVPIFLPSHMMFKDDPLENSWDVTSDSIATYSAERFNAEKVILVTDVDGIFTKDPKMHRDATLIETISAKNLLMMNHRTSVDKFLPQLLLTSQIECYVVNGKYPARIKAVLAGKRATCTVIHR